MVQKEFTCRVVWFQLAHNSNIVIILRNRVTNAGSVTNEAMY